MSLPKQEEAHTLLNDEDGEADKADETSGGNHEPARFDETVLAAAVATNVDDEAQSFWDAVFPPHEESKPLTSTAEPLTRTAEPLTKTEDMGLLVSHPQLKLASEPWCSKCGHVVDPLLPGTRVMSKSPATFCCGRCNSKTTMLTRMFGTWPIPEFKSLTAAEKKSFFSKATNDQDSLKKLIERSIVSRIVEEKMVKFEGPFHPLGVWKKLGYDTALIEEKGRKVMHAELGMTYQVRTLSDGWSKQRQMIEDEMVKLLSKYKKKGADADLPENAEAGAVDDKPKESGDDDSDSSSSSSSSSSESGKKGKKGKKNKKNKKDKKTKKKEKKAEKKEKKADEKRKKKEKDQERARVAADKASEKAEKTRVNKIKGECSRTLAKVGALAFQLGELLKDKASAKVPSVILQKAKDSHKQIVSVENEAKDKLKAACPLDLTFTLDELPALVKDRIHVSSSNLVLY